FQRDRRFNDFLRQFRRGLQRKSRAQKQKNRTELFSLLIKPELRFRQVFFLRLQYPQKLLLETLQILFNQLSTLFDRVRHSAICNEISTLNSASKSHAARPAVAHNRNRGNSVPEKYMRDFCRLELPDGYIQNITNLVLCGRLFL